MGDIQSRLFISTVGEGAADLAREHGLGLEIAEFCTAYNMDLDFDKWDAKVRNAMNGVGRFTFHAPFNELCPAAIDPMVTHVAKTRYTQAYNLMDSYGVKAMVAHSGFMPTVYYENWFLEKSVEFWNWFLLDKPADFLLHLENVLEGSPKLLCDIVRAVNDERFRLCLDTGHAAYVGSGVPIMEWVEQALPLLGHVHLHNNNGKQDSHSAFGDGVVDIASLIHKVADAAPGATFTIETWDSLASIEWMKGNGFL